MTTLVLGGTGKTGRRIVARHSTARLNALQVPVRVGSRTAPIPFDWTDSAGWPAAVAGVDRVYLSYQPDVAAPGAESAVSEFVGVARRGGVRRVVLLSGRGEPEARAVERIVAAAGLEHTVLRCSWFAQNFSAVCTGVEEVLHRAPTDFLDWAKGAAEAWSR